MVDTREPDSDEPIDEELDEQVRRPPGGAKATAALLVLTLVFLGWSGPRLASFDVDRVTAALVALTQYAVPAGALLLIVALLLRRWLTVLVVASVTAVLAVSVAPRAIPDETEPMRGQDVTVLTVNAYFGRADASRIAELVRRHDVDVLSLQEVTPGFVDDLERAGLFDELGHRVVSLRAEAGGSAIVSRYPVEPLSLVRRTTMSQPSARVDVPGSQDVQVVAVHPVVPIASGSTVTWRHELGALPRPTDPGKEPVRVLAGDFNATLDHTPMRALLGQGYVDAAGATGNGLTSTWPVRGRPWVPPVTLDHVLVSGDAAVRGYRVFDVRGTDHRAVLADLTV